MHVLRRTVSLTNQSYEKLSRAALCVLTGLGNGPEGRLQSNASTARRLTGPTFQSDLSRGQAIVSTSSYIDSTCFGFFR